MAEFHKQDSFRALLVGITKLYFAKIQDEVNEYGIYPGQIAMLILLSREDGKTQKEIADHLFIKPPTVTVTIQRMTNTGLLYKKNDAQDQRKTRIYITSEGRNVAAKMVEAVRQAEQDVFRNFSYEEIVLMKRFMVHMRKNLLETGMQSGIAGMCL